MTREQALAMVVSWEDEARKRGGVTLGSFVTVSRDDKFPRPSTFKLKLEFTAIFDSAPEQEIPLKPLTELRNK